MNIINLVDKKLESINTNSAFDIIYNNTLEVINSHDEDIYNIFLKIRMKLKEMQELDLTLLSKKNFIRYEVLSECIMVAAKDNVNLHSIESIKKLECLNLIKKYKECRKIAGGIANAYTKSIICFDIDLDLILDNKKELTYVYKKSKNK